MSFLNFVARTDGVTLADLAWRAAWREGLRPPDALDRDTEDLMLYGNIANSLRNDLKMLQLETEEEYQQKREQRIADAKTVNEELRREHQQQLARMKVAHAMVDAWSPPESLYDLRNGMLAKLCQEIGRLTLDIEEPPVILDLPLTRESAIARLSNQLANYEAEAGREANEMAGLMEKSKLLADSVGVPQAKA